MAEKPVPPKGQPKGGSRFPRHDLQICVTWARKLVTKTHSGPQPEDVIMAGVLGTSGARGEVKISAMKQFGLIDGDKSGYVASDLAKSIVNCPDEDRAAFLKQSVLMPTLFRPVFDTFQGDETSLPRIRQRFTDLKVHPDNADKCLEIYVASMQFAELGTSNGTQFTHLSAAHTNVMEEAGERVENEVNNSGEKLNELDDPNGGQVNTTGAREIRGGALITVNVNIDSSLDTEKLERHLQLLKKCGAL